MEASRCRVGNLGSEVGRGASRRQLHAQPCSVGKGQVGRVCEQPVGNRDKHIRTREEPAKERSPTRSAGARASLKAS